MNRSIPLALIAAIALAAVAVNAQPPEPQRTPLREDLRVAGEHLMHHPHPYTMSEEVARTRLQKQGLEPTEIKPLDNNRFEAQVLRNGQPVRIEMNRLNGAIQELR